MLTELRAAVEQQRQKAIRMRPPIEQEEDGEHQAAPLFRVTGSTEETVRDQLDAIRMEYQGNSIQRIDHRHIYGDNQTARRQLDEFNAQIKTIRAAISPAIGWFESFYIEKVRMSQEARAYLRKGKSIPPDVELFEGVIYGPYLKYRWQEESNGPQYTIQMGRIDGRSLQDEEHRVEDGANLNILTTSSVFPAAAVLSALAYFAEQRYGKVTGGSDLLAMYSRGRPARDQEVSAHMTEATLNTTDKPILIIS